MLDVLNDKDLVADWLRFGSMFVIVRLLEGGDLQDETWMRSSLYVLLGLGAFHLAVKKVVPKIGNGEIADVVGTWIKVGTVNVVARLLEGGKLDEPWFVSLAYTILGFNAYTLVTSKLLDTSTIANTSMRNAADTAMNVGTMLVVSRLLSGGDPMDQKWMMSALYTIAGFSAYDLVLAKMVA